MKTKFNHRVIFKYVGHVLVYGTVTFILSACMLILADVLVNGAPNIPCDICY